MKLQTVFCVAAASLTIVAATPSDAAAQFRGRVPPPGWYPMGPGYGMRPDELSASVRIQSSTLLAEVYVDGYRAGVVNDFDGHFQRLRLRPGEHDIVLYLDGHKSELRHVYMSPTRDETIKVELTKLAPGQPEDTRPVPREVPMDVERRREPARQTEPEPEPAKFGTLSLRIVPVNADIFIDGERWRNPNSLLPLVIQLSPGRHKIRVLREGYETYATEIDIATGETNSINVSLKRTLSKSL